MVTPSFAFCSALIVSSAGGASASLLLAPATSLKDPLLRSSWVIVCVPVHLTVAPGAELATGIAGVQLNPSSAGESLTDTLCSVVLPSFVAVMVYSTT